MTSLQKLQHLEPVGTPFAVRLAQEYLAFAESEADQYDWRSSRHFALKGLDVAYGKQVEPENVKDWDIKNDLHPAFDQGREYLMDVLKSELVVTHSQEVAKAQMMYDCWIEQQEENWQSEDIAACRDGFYEVIDVLYAKLYPEPVEEEEQILEQVQAPGPYRIYFGLNQNKLDANAREIIRKVIAEVRNLPSFTVNLNGYTDKSGNPSHNLKLSKRRALQVKQALVDAGVDESKLLIFAFGDNLMPSMQALPAKDVRYVEILIELNE
jgi:OOP family OmpA-OmpF porin